MNEPLYHPEVATTPFLLARHGESVRNAGEMMQGRGAEVEGLPVNGLTTEGIGQVKAMPKMLLAAGIAVRIVSSSEMIRTIESATIFVGTHPDPRPRLAIGQVTDLEEISSEGWENEFTRIQVNQLKKVALAQETVRLREWGVRSELEDYIGWIVRGGKGESPLEAAIRGVDALERYEVAHGEVVFSHGTLNRYMGAVAVHTSCAERVHLRHLIDDSTPLGGIAVLQALKEMEVAPLAVVNHSRNRQPQGSVTEFTVDVTGKWEPARRIILPREPEDGDFITLHHKKDLWQRG